MLPHLIILVATTMAIWLASRWVRHEVSRVETEMRKVQRRVSRGRYGQASRLYIDVDYRSPS